MSTRHKNVELYNGTVTVGTGKNGLFIIYREIDHSGKTNHTLNIAYSVVQPTQESNHNIDFYVVEEKFLMNAFFYRISNPPPSGYADTTFPAPTDCLYMTNNRKINDSFTISITKSSHVYFVLDNKPSFTTKKNVDLSIFEEWDEVSSSLDVITTIPPYDKSLSQDAERLISSSSTNLQIITPYIDMTLISELLKKQREHKTIEIVTRTKKEFSGKGAKEAFEHVHNNFGKNHRTNELVHSRIIIRDSIEAIVSSADLTQDSLLGQFNAGVIVSDPILIKKLQDYFTNVWQKSTPS